MYYALLCTILSYRVTTHNIILQNYIIERDMELQGIISYEVGIENY